jgi:hypothetical protein
MAIDKRLERIAMVRATIKQIKEATLAEEDPRQRADYAETLDLLEHSLEYELDQLDRQLAMEQQKKTGAA